jgi:hypothetical protein
VAQHAIVAKHRFRVDDDTVLVPDVHTPADHRLGVQFDPVNVANEDEQDAVDASQHLAGETGLRTRVTTEPVHREGLEARRRVLAPVMFQVFADECEQTETVR